MYWDTWYAAHREEKLAYEATKRVARGVQPRVRWTGGRILQAIQQFWAATGRWPVATEFTPAHGLPDGHVVHQHFGSLAAARSQAGMPGEGRVRPLLSAEERRAHQRRATDRWRAAHREQVRALQRRAQARYQARKQGRPVPDHRPVEAAPVSSPGQALARRRRLQPVLAATPVRQGRYHGWMCRLACGHTVPARCRLVQGRDTHHLPPLHQMCWCSLEEPP